VAAQDRFGLDSQPRRPQTKKRVNGEFFVAGAVIGSCSEGVGEKKKKKKKRIKKIKKKV